MPRTAADLMVDTLIDWGVEVVFGLPGDGINGIMESLRTRQDQVRFIQVRHEETAAFAACGYAKFTGKLGVCLSTSGPGGLHMLNGLYDAKLDGQSVLAITGHTYHDLIGTYYQQDVDLDRIFVDVAHYSERVMGPAHVEAVTNLACRHALAQHGVAHINFPVDLQEQPVDEEAYSKAKVPGHTTSAYSPFIQVPPPPEIQRAADILNRGEKVAIIAGRGALGAGRELEILAEKLGAPIIKAYLGKAAVPDDSPYTIGAIGLFGTRPSETAMEQCDTLLMVGTSFPYMSFLPEPGQAAAVQIDTNPVRIGLRYPVDLGLVGDAKSTMELLIPQINEKQDRSFLEDAQDGMKEWRALMEDRGTRRDMPMKPQVVAWELNKRLDPDAIIAGDSGTTTTWLARYINVQREQMISGSGNLATMASALPYAIAAQVAYPERQVVAVIGDGAMSQLMAEIATAVRYNLPIKVIVFSNNTLGQIKWEKWSFSETRSTAAICTQSTSRKSPRHAVRQGSESKSPETWARSSTRRCRSRGRWWSMRSLIRMNHRCLRRCNPTRPSSWRNHSRVESPVGDGLHRPSLGTRSRI
jgi:pyruvate dehydrogenase (quinone)